MELKETIEALTKAFEEFKALNDKRLEEIEAQGSASAETTAAVERANAEITELRTEVDKQQSALREVENKAARVDFIEHAPSSDRARLEAKHAAEFLALTGRPVADVDEVTPDQVQEFQNYRKAFFAYMRRDKESLSQEIRNTLSVGSDPEGGYWVPPDTSGRIVEFIYESSPIRQFANVQQTSLSELEGTYDLNEAGGGWVGELASRAETTTPDLGVWKIPVQELYALPGATQRMLDDAVNDVEAWLTRKAGRKLGRLEATSSVLGDGVAQMRGFATYAAGTPSAGTFDRVEQVNTGASGAFKADPDGGDVFIDAIGKIKADLRQNLTWAMSRTTEAAARKLKDSNGHYIWQPDFSAGGRPLIQGYPVALFEDIADIAANSLSIALANFEEAYTIADRVGIRVLRDPFTAKPKVLFYTTKRVGGGVVNFEAIKLIKFAA